MPENMLSNVILPGGWCLAHSKTHDRPYYYHVSTGEATWELPSMPEDVVVRTLHSVRSLFNESRDEDVEPMKLTTPRSLSYPVQPPNSENSASSVEKMPTIKEDTDEELEKTTASLDCNEGGSSEGSPASVAESLVLDRSNIEDLVSIAKNVRDKRLKELENGESVVPELHPHNVGNRTVPLHMGDMSQNKTSAVDASSKKEMQTNLSELVLQLQEEFERHKRITSHVDELTVFLSNMEVERWALEAAVEFEERDHLSLRDRLNQLRHLDVEMLAKSSSLKDAKRTLANCEDQLLALLCKAVEKKPEAVAWLETQPRATDRCVMQAQLSALEAQLRSEETSEATLLAEALAFASIVICNRNAPSARRNADESPFSTNASHIPRTPVMQTRC